MPSYEDLLNADLSCLATAVGDWQNLPKKISGMDGVSQNFENNVMKDLEGSDWHGEAASAAHSVALKIRAQLRTAGDEANDVYSLLDDALDKFTSAQNSLKAIDQQVKDPKSSVTFDGNHNVVLKDPKGTEQHPDAARYMYETVNELNDSIKKILKDATDADEALYWALSQDPNGSDQGFNEDAYHDIQGAELARQKAIVDADQAVKLAQLGPKLTPDQLEQLNKLVAEHAGDPVFGAEFATKLGAAATLGFWAKLTDPAENLSLVSETQNGDLKQLQQNLSLTLADATHYDSPQMRGWEQQVIRLGSQPIDSSRTSHPMGFQVMSNLMRFGQYDTGFLQRYGNALFQEDRMFKFDSRSGHGMTWNDIPDFQNNCTLNFFGSDKNDPMNGFMQALGHNPEAATDFFKTDNTFKYLTQERHWSEGTPGYADLGHALVAATLGRAYDAPDDALHKTSDAAHIANEVVTLYGNDPKRIHAQKGIGDSLGTIAGGYIGDIDNAIQRGNYPDLFGNSQAPLMLHIGRADAVRFLSTLGQDPDAYATVSHAQRLFTSNALRAHLPAVIDPDDPSTGDAEPIVYAGAYTQGLLDKSRIEEAKQLGVASDAAYNQALSQKKDWVKIGTNGLVDVAAAFVPKPEEGVMKTLVPPLISTGGSALKTAYSHALDSDPSYTPRSTSESVQEYTAGIAQAGEDSTYAPYQDIRNEIPGLSSPGRHKLGSNLDTQARLGYASGSGDQDLMGHLPQTGVQ